MNLKELADLKYYLDPALRPKKEDLLRIRGANVSNCFTEPKHGDGGVVVIYFSLVFTYENAERDIFIVETKSEVSTDEITLTRRFKKALLKAMGHKFDLFTERIKPYL